MHAGFWAGHRLRPAVQGLHVPEMVQLCTVVPLPRVGSRGEMVPGAARKHRPCSSSPAATRKQRWAERLPRRLLPMFFERLTAWTLVVVYYTITCGAIVLGLRGAL